jgi:hypothetical protein
MKRARNKVADKQLRSSLGTFQALSEPMGNPVCVALPLGVDALVRSLSNRSEWLRRVITEAAQRELLTAEQDREGDTT